MPFSRHTRAAIGVTFPRVLMPFQYAYLPSTQLHDVDYERGSACACRADGQCVFSRSFDGHAKMRESYMLYAALQMKMKAGRHTMR